MAAVATWRDGPRYAPAARPMAFAQPSSAVALGPDVTVAQPAGPVAPAEPPQTYQATAGVPLEQIVVTTSTPRDPTQSYQVTSSTMTALEASVAGERDPTQPYTIVATTVTSPAWAAPVAPPARPAPVVTHPVSVKAMLVAAYPALIITLAIGAVWSLMSILALATATVLLVRHVSFRVRQLRATCYILLALTGVAWIVVTWLNSSIHNWGLSISGVGQVFCAVALVVDLGLQWWGLRRGERPAPRRVS